MAILDGHVHLWPCAWVTSGLYPWMSKDSELANDQLLDDYLRDVRQSRVAAPGGIVFIETDVRRDPTHDHRLAGEEPLPMVELAFLRSMIKTEPFDKLLKAIIPHAPFDQSKETFTKHLHSVTQHAGPQLSPRVKGYRFLLQGLETPDEFGSTVLSDTFIENLKLCGQLGLSFEVCVTQHQGGSQQLELTLETMRRAHSGVPDAEKVTFILDHLCKPVLASSTSAEYTRWCEAIREMALCRGSYIKLSGILPLLPERFLVEPDPAQIAKHIRPWVLQAFQNFGADRVLFGSDWPMSKDIGLVDRDAWSLWFEVVENLLNDDALGFDEAARQGVWQDNAWRAYRLCAPAFI